MAQNSGAPRSQEDYITQVSEEIEGRVTKRLSKEFSRTENRILGALARLDDFLMNPLLPGGSGATPEPTRNASGINQGTNEDDSQNDPRPEAGLFHGQMAQNSGPEGDHDNNGRRLGNNYGRKMRLKTVEIEKFVQFWAFWASDEPNAKTKLRQKLRSIFFNQKSCLTASCRMLPSWYFSQ